MTDPRATELRALHVPGTPLILPNVWDGASTHAVQDAGFRAIATGSAAVAAVLGYRDGEDTPPAEMFAAIARIVRLARVPVTADVERGYGLPPKELAERLAETGAVGCNLEDSDPRTNAPIDAARQADFLAEVRAADPDLVINARVDSFLHPDADQEEAADRARRYLAAGADCVYPIGLSDAERIRWFVREVGGPVNILFRPGTPSLAELATLGVARVSYGHGLHAAAHARAVEMISAIRSGASPYQ
ncbi:isocitrate lyase/phosphoenolpyruvate mutase family protein [Nonomuraea sp. NPDC050328]|uniref:isocitrate lyase/phosphoenolpyruvate mutase family protein n=1 Tax=Nonomuraea sp. NPDC050328 TaxID=3364361 RepID=UPI0037AB4A7C